MKRALALVGAVCMSVTAVGCGSDPREGLVAAALTQLDDAATKIANIKIEIDKAVKKTEAGKAPDFKDALLAVDALKKAGKEMQKLKMETEALKEKTTEAERKELADQFKARLNTAIDRHSKERKDLNDTVVAAEAQYKDALKPVRDKLTEAEGEFEAIARQR